MKEKEIRALVESELKNMWGSDFFALYAPPRVRYYQTDIFGVFDIIAIAPHSQLPYFIQITTVNHRSERYKKIKDWLRRFDLYKFNSAWLWCYDKEKMLFRKEVVMLNDFTS